MYCEHDHSLLAYMTVLQKTCWMCVNDRRMHRAECAAGKSMYVPASEEELQSNPSQEPSVPFASPRPVRWRHTAFLQRLEAHEPARRGSVVPYSEAQ
ncbi:hypothetical protein FQN60_017590 [Etheostoma spectabile]|uniref:Uncharacterized protein n=1 Tax=Etheostoma spectabile TaxID=54343 RepID=A0A5J5DFL0_9PERO|nr:hypothetical protein FQN60_017590 [Etheostoma spectabile]